MELNIPGTALCPLNHDKTLVEIQLRCEFEPHGRASETWEFIWRLKLVGQQAAWRDINGDWQNCRDGLEAKFSGRTLGEVIDEANAYIRARGFTLTTKEES